MDAFTVHPIVDLVYVSNEKLQHSAHVLKTWFSGFVSTCILYLLPFCFNGTFATVHVPLLSWCIVFYRIIYAYVQVDQRKLDVFGISVKYENLTIFVKCFVNINAYFQNLFASQISVEKIVRKERYPIGESRNFLHKFWGCPKQN